MRNEVFAFVTGMTLALIVAIAFEKLQQTPNCKAADPFGLFRAAPMDVLASAGGSALLAKDVVELQATADPAIVDAEGATPTVQGARSYNEADEEIRRGPEGGVGQPDQAVEPGMLAVPIGPDTPLDVTVWYVRQDEPLFEFAISELVRRAVRGGNVTRRPLEQVDKWKPHVSTNLIENPNEANILFVNGAAEEPYCNNAIVSKSAYLTPAVAFLLGDDGTARCVERKLADMNPLVLRTGASGEALRRPAIANVATVPIGYSASGFGKMASDVSVKGPWWYASKRALTWVFLPWHESEVEGAAGLGGTLDAAFPKNEFAKKPPDSTAATAATYVRAQFAPVAVDPNGKIVDSPRIYEAAACGAIPVVVGPIRAYEPVFSYIPTTPAGVTSTPTKSASSSSPTADAPMLSSPSAATEMPPWIIAASWDDAVTRMQKLLDDPAALDQLQAAVAAWWDDTLARAVAAVRRPIEADYLRRQTLAELGRAWQRSGRDDIAARFLKPVAPWAGTANLSGYDLGGPKTQPAPAMPMRGRRL